MLPIPKLFLYETSGTFKGLPIYGNSEVISLRWETYQIKSLVIEIDLTHFYWKFGCIQEDENRIGFYHCKSRNTDGTISMALLSPNKLSVSFEVEDLTLGKANVVPEMCSIKSSNILSSNSFNQGSYLWTLVSHKSALNIEIINPKNIRYCRISLKG